MQSNLKALMGLLELKKGCETNDQKWCLEFFATKFCETSYVGGNVRYNQLFPH